MLSGSLIDLGQVDSEIGPFPCALVNSQPPWKPPLQPVAHCHHYKLEETLLWPLLHSFLKVMFISLCTLDRRSRITFLPHLLMNKDLKTVQILSILIFFLSSFFFFGLPSQLVGSEFPRWGIKPTPTCTKAQEALSPNHWPPGNSLYSFFLSVKNNCSLPFSPPPLPTPTHVYEVLEIRDMKALESEKHRIVCSYCCYYLVEIL